MELFFLVALVLIALATFAALTKKQPKDSSLSYQSKEVLFTQAERSFLGVLEQALDGRRYRVLGKVRLGDMVKPAKGLSKSNRTTALNKINQKHVDFVICTTDDLALVAAIELDDQSHERNDRAERDQFVDRVLRDAKIPIAHFSAKRGYAIHEVRTKLLELGLKQSPAMAPVAPSAAPSETESAKEPTTPSPKEKRAANEALPLPKETQPAEEALAPPSEEAAPTCPKCSVRMVKRKAVKGPHAGKSFWACPNFPNCRHVVAIETF